MGFIVGVLGVLFSENVVTVSWYWCAFCGVWYVCGGEQPWERGKRKQLNGSFASRNVHTHT